MLCICCRTRLAVSVITLFNTQLAPFESQVSVSEAALLETSKMGIWSCMANFVYTDGHSLLAGMAQWRMAAP